MNFHTQHPMQPFWNLAGAAIQAQALELALEFKLFEHLSLPADADLVALQLNMPAPAATVWLDLLWSMGLLELATGDTRRYRSSDLAQQYFVAASAQSCAASWRYRRQALRGFADQMAGLLGHEGSAAGRGKMGSWAQAAREQISQEQKAVSVPAVLRQLQRWGGLPAEGRFLDLGCGPGHVGIALAQALPGWHGVVCDQAETAAVAQEHVQAAGLSERVSAQAADLNRESPGQGYDLVWCSSVLHFLQSPQAALEAICAATRPGGVVVMAHAEVPDDPLLASKVMPFYATMMLRGNYLPRAGEMAQNMARAGLQQVQSLGRIDFPMAPVWLYTGRRP